MRREVNRMAKVVTLGRLERGFGSFAGQSKPFPTFLHPPNNCNRTNVLSYKDQQTSKSFLFEDDNTSKCRKVTGLWPEASDDHENCFVISFLKAFRPRASFVYCRKGKRLSLTLTLN